MIFVTVGTHEQQFNRLLREVDQLKGKGFIEDEVVIQSGFSDYEMKHCEARRWIPYDEMSACMEEARLVITHGGPASFIAPLQVGKIPIVVPRQKQYGEHVNDHQIDFCEAVAERQKNIILVKEIEKLEESIRNYESIVNIMSSDVNSNNEVFCRKLENMVNRLLRIG